ncbi:MAG: hypothetical protein BZ138_02710 [Methanosphaera sp. rholeuAM270]|nr:MAG: hypothetical protein BZ138_02710 [Methanosphaera sp. rholeuAM270]
MFKNKTMNLFDEKIRERKIIYDELLKKELESLNTKIKSDKYDVNKMITKSGFGNVYHDLLDSKDKLSSEYQSKYNQAYHSIDVELYKLNKRIDRETKSINYRYNNKKEKVYDQVLSKIM